MERSELEAHINELRKNSDTIPMRDPNWIAYLQLETMLKILDWQERHMNMLTSIDEGQNILLERLAFISEQLAQAKAYLESVDNIVSRIKDNTSK